MTYADQPKTIYQKIRDRHTIVKSIKQQDLLYVDYHFLNETSFLCFQELERTGRSLKRPKRSFMVVDHTVPTSASQEIQNPENRDAVNYLEDYAKKSGMVYIGPKHPLQGIGHIVGSELGITLPGALIAGDDSHTTTNGALGALALGIGLSEVTHVLATQTLWQPSYKSMRVNLSGRLSPATEAKDLILTLIGKLGSGGGTGYIIEFAGSCLATLNMSQRMTICNMALEAGARAAIMAPDDITLEYIAARTYAPQGADWDRALLYWRKLRTDQNAIFDQEVSIDASTVAPTITWGTSTQDITTVDGIVPLPDSYNSPDERQRVEAALAYMGLTPGTRITDIKIDQVFIGSCTNGRLEDLRLAAAVARQGKAVVPAMVVPGSKEVKRAAEQEGLDKVFLAAGFEWRNPGCSMCLGMNGDIVAPGKRCASTTNRNFMGRQGPGARTHLMGPAMAAAAALNGRISDVRHYFPV